MLSAVIDLGTNTFHLLIADVKPGGAWKKVLHRKISVRLGKDGIHKGEIAPASFKRGLKALTVFRQDLNGHSVKKIKAFGTAAIRSASNGKEFQKYFREIIGVGLQVIDGETEAELICNGVRNAVEMGDEKCLIMDIGGGSTEFIIADRKKIYWKHSFKLGSTFLLETFKPSDPLSASDHRKMRYYFDDSLQPMFKAFDRYRPLHLIGSAGSFETFSSMIRHRHPASGSHYGKKSHPISVSQIKQLNKDLIRSTHDERIRMRGLLRLRADMIVPASMLLRHVLDRCGIMKITMSAYSLKEGALIS